MRRKPGTQGSGGYNNQQRKPRYQQGGSNGGEHRSHNSGYNSGHGGGGRPRKNYTALREKYLGQARDALASGDRVLAENWFQHADHCYRMMVEEGYQVRNNYTPPPQGAEGSEQQGEQADDHGNGNGSAQHEHNAAQGGQDDQEGTQDDTSSDTISQLPAFLTTIYDHPDQAKAAEPVIVQNWEE